MKKIYFILFALLLTIPGFGQTSENDSLTLEIKKTNTLEGSRLRDRYPNLHERNIFDEQSSAPERQNYTISGEISDSNQRISDMNIHIPEFYRGPLHDYLSDSKYPYANDYAYHAGYRLSDRSWLSTSSTRDTYPLAGGLTNIGGTYNYLLTDNLTLSAGAYISKYRIGMNLRNDAGVNAALKFQITDRIAIHGFGQYSAFGKENGMNTRYTPWYPTSNFGGAFEYKVTERFGIMGGMERQLNPMTGKWKNVPFIMPVFYGK